MWCVDDFSTRHPVAALFSRSLELVDAPQSAVVKICGDQQYVLWINGSQVMAGSNRPDFELDTSNVTELLHAGINVISIEARSASSVGGVLFALDIVSGERGRAQGDPNGDNVVVSGPDWQCRQQWGEGPGVVGESTREPVLWGRPPRHPWGFPPLVPPTAPLATLLGSKSKVIRQRDFTQLRPGIWVGGWSGVRSGYLLVHLPEDYHSDVAMEVFEYVDGPSYRRQLDVVAVEGQHEWLSPEAVRGNRVLVQGPRPPEQITLVELAAQPKP